MSGSDNQLVFKFRRTPQFPRLNPTIPRLSSPPESHLAPRNTQTPTPTQSQFPGSNQLPLPLPPQQESPTYHANPTTNFLFYFFNSATLMHIHIQHPNTLRNIRNVRLPSNILTNDSKPHSTTLPLIIPHKHSPSTCTS